MDKQKVLSIDEVEDLLTKDSKRLMENLQEEEQGIILQAVANVINRTGMKGKVTLRDGMTDVIHGAGYLLENKNHEVIKLAVGCQVDSVKFVLRGPIPGKRLSDPVAFFPVFRYNEKNRNCRGI